jgi:hypothetical protein
MPGSVPSSGLGLPAYTPHGLRHTWATMPLTNGASLHEVSRWLGHRSIKVTVDRYGHLTQDGRERCRHLVATTFQGRLPEELPAGPAARPLADSELAQDPVLTRC